MIGLATAGAMAAAAALAGAAPPAADRAESAPIAAVAEAEAPAFAFVHPHQTGPMHRAMQAALGARDAGATTLGMAARVLRAEMGGAPHGLPPEEREALRLAALDALEDRARPWGMEPFLLAAAYEGHFPSRRALAEYLVVQLRDDDIPGNALASCDLLLAALRADPLPFASTLAREAQRLRVDDDDWQAKVPHGPLLAAHLALLWAADDQESFAASNEAWWWMQRADHRPESCTNFARLAKGDREALLDAAELLAVRDLQWRVDKDFDAAAFGARRLAWALFENAPMEHERLARMIRSESNHDAFAIERLVTLWLLRDPASLLAPPWDGVLPDAIAKAPWARWAALSAVLAPDDAWETGLEKRFAARLGTLHGPALREPDPAKAAFVREYRAAYHAQARWALARTADPTAQLRLCEMLILWEDREARGLVAQVLVSHLPDDDIMENANRATRGLEQMGGGIAIDAARAGLRLGTEMGDWQLIERTTKVLLALDPDFDPAAHPRAIAAMAAHLADDDIEGNAAAARWFLRLCGPAARPALMDAVENGDAQARAYARGILRDLD